MSNEQRMGYRDIGMGFLASISELRKQQHEALIALHDEYADIVAFDMRRAEFEEKRKALEATIEALSGVRI